jgi:hypothetical protein
MESTEARRGRPVAMNDPGLRRRKLLAFFLSGIFPGLGQLYNRELLKGALFLVAGVVLSWLIERAVPTDLLTASPIESRLLVPLFLLLAIWIWSSIDAWRARRA